VRATQFVQDRRPRPARPDDEHRRRDALVEDLGMTLDRGADLEAVGERAHDLVAGHDAAEQVQVGFLLERPHEDSERFAPGIAVIRRVRVAEVVESGCGAGRGEKRLLVERHDRGRRSEMRPERVQLGHPERTRLGRPRHGQR
jgi:hypothetical protein